MVVLGHTGFNRMAKLAVTVCLVLVVGIAQADIYSYRAADGSIVFTDEPTKGSKTVKIEKPMVVPSIKQEPQKQNTPVKQSKPMWPEPAATTLPQAEKVEKVPAYDASSNTSWSSDTQGITSTKPRVKKEGKPIVYASEKPKLLKTKKPTEKKKGYNSLRILSPTAGSSRWVGGELTVELALVPALRSGHVVSLRVDGREVSVGPSTQIVVPNIARGKHSLRAAVLDTKSGKQLIVSPSVSFQVQRASKNRNSKMLHPSIKKN